MCSRTCINTHTSTHSGSAAELSSFTSARKKETEAGRQAEFQVSPGRPHNPAEREHTRVLYVGYPLIRRQKKYSRILRINLCTRIFPSSSFCCWSISPFPCTTRARTLQSSRLLIPLWLLTDETHVEESLLAYKHTRERRICFMHDIHPPTLCYT